MPYAAAFQDGRHALKRLGRHLRARTFEADRVEST